MVNLCGGTFIQYNMVYSTAQVINNLNNSFILIPSSSVVVR